MAYGLESSDLFLLWCSGLGWTWCSSIAKGSLAGGSSSSSLWMKIVWCCCHGVLKVCLDLVNPVWVFCWSALLPLGCPVTEVLVLGLPGWLQFCLRLWPVGSWGCGGADGGNCIGGCHVMCHGSVE